MDQSQAGSIGGSAYMAVENSEVRFSYRHIVRTQEFQEPYLEGVKFSAQPPLKRFREMEHLSGGEKTMAALALVFAINRFLCSYVNTSLLF